jgi:hypothetical protein
MVQQNQAAAATAAVAALSPSLGLSLCWHVVPLVCLDKSDRLMCTARQTFVIYKSHSLLLGNYLIS